MSIQDQITHLSGFIASADLSDLQQLADLHTQFETIARWATDEASDRRLAEAMKAGTDLIESIILNEVPDVPNAIQAIERTISILQEVIGEGKNSAEADFPPELELPSVQSETGYENTLQLKIEQLSEAFVLADLTSPSVLAGLHTRFQEIGELTRDQYDPIVTEVVEKTADLIENIILGDVPDREASLKTIGRIVSILQSICSGSLNAGEIEYPAELGLEPPTRSQDGGDNDSKQVPITLPTGVDPHLFGDFLVRQKSALEEIEAHCLSLEKEDDDEKLGSLQRRLHTLKGEAGMLGLADVERLCHSTEDMLKKIRPGQIVDLLLDIKDWLIDIFDAYAGNESQLLPVEGLLDRIRNTAREQPPKPLPADLVPTPELAEMDLDLTSEFINEALEHLESGDLHLLTLESEPENEEALNAVFRAFHTIKGVAGCLELNEIRALSHEAENLLDRARKGDLTLTGHSIDVTFSSVDALKNMVNHLSDSLASGIPPSPYESLPQLLTSIQNITSGKSSNDFPTPEVVEPSASSPEIESPSVSQSFAEKTIPLEPESTPPTSTSPETVKEEIKPAVPSPSVQASSPATVLKTPVKIREIVKVDADRLDHLVETIGELVIAVSMVRQATHQKNDDAQQIERQMRQLDKITRGLQGMGMSLRMVPVRATFQKMSRLVRDLSRKTGKPIDFVMSGVEAELDKAVVDKIGDPLVHMIRNAVDHGIEDSPEDRKAARKPETGRIELRAFHKGGNIIIEIEDDGRGMNKDAILTKSKERGIIHDGDVLSDREIFNLIFEPGFSTAKQVTEVSGRGVGMDVVKRNIEALRGQVDIRSEPSKGSIITISLPLTLAIIDGMVVRVGGKRYIIPTLSIVQSLQPKAEDISTVFNRGEMLKIHDKLIPIFRLADLFRLEHSERDPAKALIVVVENNDRLAGLLVDELVGQQQIVIKSIGEVFREVPGVSGGAILSDGLVGLILDVGGLVRLANENSPRWRALRSEAVMNEI